MTPAPPGLSVPMPVVDIDLAEPGAFRRPGGRVRIGPSGRALGLVRLHGRPLGMAEASGHGPGELWQALADAALRDFPAADVADPGPRAAPAVAASDPGAGGLPAAASSPGPRSRTGVAPAPEISVIVATRNRAGMLRDCLDSLLALTYPRFEVIVVDNAPADGSTEELIRREYGPLRDGDGAVRKQRPVVRYLREPVPGLARAHNRGLAAARGRIAAFTDDDTLVDPGWLTALAAPFLADARTGCVTGLIVPAELDTEAQVALERHGAFAKGYAPRTWSLRAPPADPLFPFTAGRFGSGANMAFRTDLLRELGGFDPATGVGTPAHGGDDLLSFFRVLARGRSLAYEPAAIVWHRHRRTPEALEAQAFGYGAGFGAYLAGALVHEPRMLPALLRRLPGGVRYALARSRERAGRDTGRDTGPDTGPGAVGGAGAGAGPAAGSEAGSDAGADAAARAAASRIAQLELRGLLYGPFGYLRSRRDERRLRRRAAHGPGAHTPWPPGSDGRARVGRGGAVRARPGPQRRGGRR
ncbi:glycosyltransferase [Streptomyces sp. NPDC056361]|uniref:glycosyltransferase n=1 Tax=Streptomyces sp. NPDC056361 TaxID=3345795 RepID=UPI0035DC1A03